MCVDVEPGMRTAAAAVAWEAGAKISLLVLALSLLDRGCVAACVAAAPGAAAACVAAVVAAAAAAGVAAARGGGPQEAIRPSRW